MGAMGNISGVTASLVTAGVAKVTQAVRAGPRAAISAVKKITTHRTPPAGLLAFDPNAPEVDLAGQPQEQIRALHQYRTSIQLLEREPDGTQVDASS